MNFIQRLFERKPFTLSQLIFVNAKEGGYKNEILKTLKTANLFLGLPQPPTGATLDLNDPNNQMLVVPTQDGKGYLLMSFVDASSLKKHNATSFPYPVDFATISKLLETPTFFGLMICSGRDHVVLSKSELAV